MSAYATEVGLEFGELGEFEELGEFGEYGELGEFGEFEGEGEFGEFEEVGEFEELGEYGEYEGEGEFGEFAEYEELAEYGEYEGEGEQFLGGILGSLLGGEVSPLSEAQEIELASELLEISSEAELEQFLGSLVKRVGRGVGGFIRSPAGRALGGILKGVAKKALPVVGGALGSMVAPGIGTAIGSKLGSMASGLFEVELEALPPEVAEFEAARRVVNLAAAAARNAALARPQVPVTPKTLARAAVASAAKMYAPGLYKGMMRSLGAAPGLRRPGVIPRVAARPGVVRRAGVPIGLRRTGVVRRAGVPIGLRRTGLAPVGVRRRPGFPARYRPRVGAAGYGRRVPGARRYPRAYGRRAWPGYGGSGWPAPWYGGEPAIDPTTGAPVATGAGAGMSGTWFRRGGSIVVQGA